MLNPDKFKFLKYKKVELTVSIDGPSAIHNAHRRIKTTKKATLDKILKNIKQIPPRDRKGISTITVIAPDNCSNLMGRFLFIRELGFVNIRFSPVFQPSRWGKAEIADFSCAMEDFSNAYCKLFLAGEANKVFIIDALRDILRGRMVKKREVYCLEARLEDCNSVWLDPAGGFYVCERVLGVGPDRKNRYKIGSVEKGIDFSLRDSFLYKAGKAFRDVLAKKRLKESNCFFCPFSFYFRESIEDENAGPREPFSFYFSILKIYKKSFHSILKVLRDNSLFKKIYGLNYDRNRI